MIQVVLNWLIAQDNVVPIPGARNGEQAKEFAGAVGWKLSDDQVDELRSMASEIKPVVGFPVENPPSAKPKAEPSGSGPGPRLWAWDLGLGSWAIGPIEVGRGGGLVPIQPVRRSSGFYGAVKPETKSFYLWERFVETEGHYRGKFVLRIENSSRLD
ncbi:uncharacterized oxidoreductase at1g06690 chloroplastic [Phtheirospermum japonicum]|uniref:Uncharacterized oxidoreductase at1g06690 chloroplastic n=1 Tax=Phtheirospermum japonicum TaxID=374723 RepID=A0A830CDI3_9LAMI|nr:uncharacterized oxidoreductase at1g06690 chloroplastic [Phtheirospermum japonicum]